MGERYTMKQFNEMIADYAVCYEYQVEVAANHAKKIMKRAGVKTVEEVKDVLKKLAVKAFLNHWDIQAKAYRVLLDDFEMWTNGIK